VIVSFGDGLTAALFNGYQSASIRRFSNELVRAAVRKLDLINAAQNVNDLRSPPGNRLERLRGDLEGHYSIRVNLQWRIVFKWDGSDAHDVRLVDYH
jgi:proteic killer suppression protein